MADAPVSAHVDTSATTNQTTETTNETSEQNASSETSESTDSTSTETKTEASNADIKKVAKEVGMTPKELKKVLKIKVDGTEIEKTIDWNDEADLIKKVQLAEVAQKRMQEASDYQKKVAKFVDLLQNDPEEALRQMGHNVDDLAKKYMTRQIEEMKKSPEQVAQEKLQKELEQLRKDKASAEEKAHQAEMSKIQDKLAQEVTSDIQNALKDSKELPYSEDIVRKVADAMLQAYDLGYTKIKASEVIPFVKAEMHRELQRLFAVMPEELMETVIGKSNLDRLRKSRVAKAKVDNIRQAVKPVQADVQSKSEKKVKERDFFKNLK